MQLPLVAGELTSIAPNIWRLLAPNPGMMTGPGTNTYLLATDTGLLVLDPGPEDATHVAAIVQASHTLKRPITHIVVTHTHRDHSPGSQALLTHFPQALRLGQPAPDDGLQDEQWKPDVVLEDGSTIPLINNEKLITVSTPGHVGNHLCFFHEKEGLLFTGDHLIEGSTVVVAPPSGSMSAYLTSLKKLQPLHLKHIAPGHGNLIPEPQAYIQRIIEHRLAREKKVLAALSPEKGQSLTQLVAIAYADTPPLLHPVAQYSLWAHLIKLEEDGIAKQDTHQLWLLQS